MLDPGGRRGNASRGRSAGRSGHGFRSAGRDRPVRPCPIRLPSATVPAWPSTSGSRTWSPPSRSPSSSTRRSTIPTRCTGTTRSRSRSCSTGAAGSCSAAESLDARPGDVFFIDNSQPHVALPDAGAPLRLLLVLFRPELIAGPGCRALDLGYLAPFRAGALGGSPRIEGGTPLARDARRGPGAAARGVRPPRPGGAPPRSTRRCGSALALVLREPDAASAEAARAVGDRREQIRPVLAYVDGHCGEGITLGDVAGLVHVSPSRVRHVFKDVTGVSFKEYLTQVRVAEAKRLLLGTDLSVAEIARRVELHQPAPVLQGVLPVMRHVARGVPPLLHAVGRRGDGYPGDGGRARGGRGVSTAVAERVGVTIREARRRRLGGGGADLPRRVRRPGRRARLPPRLPDGRRRGRAHPVADRQPARLRRGRRVGRPGDRLGVPRRARPDPGDRTGERGSHQPGPPRRPAAHGGLAGPGRGGRRPGRPADPDRLPQPVAVAVREAGHGGARVVRGDARHADPARAAGLRTSGPRRPTTSTR